MDPKSLQLPHDYGRKRAAEPQRPPASASTHPPNRPVGWGLKAMAWASLTSLGLVMLALFALMIVFVMAGMFTGLIDMDAMATMDPMTGNLGEVFGPGLLLAMMVTFFCLEAIMIPVAWFFGPRKAKGGLRQLGFRPMALGRGILLVAAALGVTLLVNFGWGLLIEFMGWQDQGDVLGLFGDGVLGLLAALFAGGIVAPIAEEVFFRGFLYAGLRDRFLRAGQTKSTSIILGILTSSIIFSLIHVTPSVLVPIAIMGGLMAWLYEETDSLWAPIMLHAANNALAFLAMYAAKFID